jgi:hypothetical protein
MNLINYDELFILPNNNKIYKDTNIDENNFFTEFSFLENVFMINENGDKYPIFNGSSEIASEFFNKKFNNFIEILNFDNYKPMWNKYKIANIPIFYNLKRDVQITNYINHGDDILLILGEKMLTFMFIDKYVNEQNDAVYIDTFECPLIKNNIIYLESYTGQSDDWYLLTHKGDYIINFEGGSPHEFKNENNKLLLYNDYTINYDNLDFVIINNVIYVIYFINDEILIMCGNIKNDIKENSSINEITNNIKIEFCIENICDHCDIVYNFSFLKMYDYFQPFEFAGLFINYKSQKLTNKKYEKQKAFEILSEYKYIFNEIFQKEYRHYFKCKQSDFAPSFCKLKDSPINQYSGKIYFNFWKYFMRCYPGTQNQDILNIFYDININEIKCNVFHGNLKKISRDEFDNLIKIIYHKEYQTNPTLYNNYTDWFFLFYNKYNVIKNRNTITSG